MVTIVRSRLLYPIVLCGVLLLVSERSPAQEPELFGTVVPAQLATPSTRSTLATADIDGVRQWDGYVQSLIRDGSLRLNRMDENTVIEGHAHERFTQYFRGVRIYGSGISRELVGGLAVSLSGIVYDNVDVDTSPTLSVDAVVSRVLPALGDDVMDVPELIVLPNPDDTYTLAYLVDVINDSEFTLYRYVLDAHSGDVLRRFDAFRTQDGKSSLGKGTKGDTKKLSVVRRPTWNVDLALDKLRPVDGINTYDMGFDTMRGWDHITRGTPFKDTELAATPSGREWEDAMVVDAHAYLGWTYDYLYERFLRHGLDGRDGRIKAIVNWPHPNMRLNKYLGGYFCNAFYFPPPRNLIFLGSGLTRSFTDGRNLRPCNPLAGAFEIVAHELVHGVTATSSNLIYWMESGALNEAFSDILGVSAEFFHASKGSGLPYAANYQIGDTTWVRPIRDMADPSRHFDFIYSDGSGAINHPDHYGSRWLPTDPKKPADAGWVHRNSSIVNHAFYLAIEGGRNRRSNKTVQGVGASNRADVEYAFYQAFTYHLNPTSTMRAARYWTIQKAPTAAARRALLAAWEAVGVHANQEVRVKFRSVSKRTSASCSLAMQIDITTGAKRFDVSSLRFDLHSVYGDARLREATVSASRFREYFGRSSIPPHTTVRSSLCWTAPSSHVSLELDLTGRLGNGVNGQYYSGRWQSFYNR